MRLIVTRPRPDAELLRERLEHLGHEVIASPLLEIVPRPDIEIPRSLYQLIAFTSANALRSLAGHPRLDQLRDVAVMAVGPQSAAAARQAGFSRITETGGDGVGLARHIVAHARPEAGPVLYLSGRDTVSDFSGRLADAGFTVTRVIVYDAHPAATLVAEAAHADGVLLYSPRSARLWLDLSGRQGIAAHDMMHFCLSPNIAAILPEGFARRVAARPDEDSLLETIGRA